MSGLKMMKRTGGIEEFEFIGLADALSIINNNKEKRLLERQKKGKSDTKQEELEIQKEINENVEHDSLKVTSNKELLNEEIGDVLWEFNHEMEEKTNSPDKKENLGSWANLGSKGDGEEHIENPLARMESTIKDPIPPQSRQTNVLITVAGWVSYDKVFETKRMITHIRFQR